MKKTIRLLMGLLLMALFASSCAGGKGKTQTQFVFMGTSFQMSSYTGGMLFWASRSDGTAHLVEAIDYTQYQNLLDQSVNLSGELPNGEWNFFAIGWRGAEPLTGGVSCAQVIAKKLSGGDETISLVLENVTCASKVFSMYANADDISGVNRFPVISSINSCKSFSSLTAASNSVSCNETSGNLGFPRSFRIGFQNVRIGEVGTLRRVATSVVADGTNSENTMQLMSVCLPISVAGTTDYVSSLNFPTGNGQKFLRTTLQSYWTDDCSGSGFSDQLQTGLHHPENSPHFDVKFFYDQTSSSYRLFIKKPGIAICDTPSYGVEGFPYGKGTSHFPFGICSPADFDKIRNYMSSSFILLKDIDFNPFTKAYIQYLQKNSLSLPPGFPDDYFGSNDCHEIGNNFTPIGLEYTGSPPDSCYLSMNGAAPFTGRFDGDQYTLKNLRFEARGSNAGSSIGLFSKLGESAEIVNLKLQSPEIRAEQSYRAGLLFGESSCSTLNCKIENVMIIDGDLEIKGSPSSVVAGSVAGYAMDTTFNKVLSLNSRVYCNSDMCNIGGLVGSAMSTMPGDSFIDSGFIGSLTFDSMYSAMIGGLVGQGDQEAKIVNSFSEGHMSGRAGASSYIGGLVGSFGSGYLSSSYSSMAISVFGVDSGTSNLFIGGLAGDFSYGNSAQNYFAGSMNYSNQASGSSVGMLFGKGGGSSYPNTYNLSRLTSDPKYGASSVGDPLTGPSTKLTLSNLRAAYLALNPNPFRIVGEDLPRVPSELDHWKAKYLPLFRPCSLLDAQNSLAIQSTVNGRGSELKPLIICGIEQLGEISSVGQLTPHYILGRDLYLPNFGNSTPNNLIQTLNGSFNGLNHNLFGVKHQTSGSLIGTITTGSSVKNLNFISPKIIVSGMTSIDAAILATDNDGVVENVKVKQAQLRHDGTEYSDHFGGLVKINDGRILKSLVSLDAYFEGNHAVNLGGIALVNNNSILKSTASIRLSLNGWSSYESSIGGIASVNNGSIAQAEVEGGIVVGQDDIYDFFEGYIGAIVGKNLSGGTIDNSLVRDHFQMKLIYIDYINTFIGGVAGLNAGKIQRVINGAKPILFYGETAEYTGPIVGKDDGYVENSYFTNKPYTFEGSLGIDYCSFVTGVSVNVYPSFGTFTSPSIGDYISIEPMGYISTDSQSQGYLLNAGPPYQVAGEFSCVANDRAYHFKEVTTAFVNTEGTQFSGAFDLLLGFDMHKSSKIDGISKEIIDYYLYGNELNAPVWEFESDSENDELPYRLLATDNVRQ